MSRALRHLKRRSLVALAVGLVGASAALAYFTSAGSGQGSASAGTTQPVTLSAGTPTVALYPGGQADVALTISNPNPVSVRIGSLALDPAQGSGGFAVDSQHTGCSVSALSYAAQSVGWTVPPKSGSTNGSLTVDLTNAISMSASAANACQGASFTVYLKAGS